MNVPPTIRLQINDRYGYLWLKEVRNVDLTQHCASALVGSYQPQVNAGRLGADLRHEPINLELSHLAPARAYYLCGVTRPYVWARNAHIAMEPDETAGSATFESHGLTVETSGLRRIEFSEADIDPADPNIGRAAYRTCRNWQFAHWLAVNRLGRSHGEVLRLFG